MGKLHEVLAVDKDLENVANKIMDEAVQTFTKRTEHFAASDKRLDMFDDNRRNEEAAGHEVKDMVTTVPKKLDYVGKAFIRHIDAVAQKERTNQEARADIVLDDGTTVLATNVPATMLLSLESKLAKLRNVYETIPTLEPGIEWVEDPQTGEGVFRAKIDEIRLKTEKKMVYTTVVQASDKHPAQVDKNTEDKAVGTYTNVRWSGRITPHRKSELIGRIDELQRAVKKARMRANNTEVIDTKIGSKLIDFINM